MKQVVLCNDTFVVQSHGYLAAYRIVHYHNTERKQPLFLRLDVFIIPWIIAFIVQNIPGLYLVIDVPCAAISLHQSGGYLWDYA
ncbi:MAG: hypothetical protein K5668_02585 [Lachnospiraceae bacterium]|nr:hypothetical protein [Lachnospiraceae bacterium]